MPDRTRWQEHTVSINRFGRWFGVPRSSFYYEPTGRRAVIVDEALAVELRNVIDANLPYRMSPSRAEGWIWRAESPNQD